MQVRIEGLVHGLDALDAVAFEHVEQLALGHGHAFEEALEGRILLGSARGYGVDGALEVVADVDDVPSEPRDRIFGGLFLLAFRPLADVLDFRVSPQQPVLEVGRLGLQGDDHVMRRPRRRLGRALLGCCARIAVGTRRAYSGGTFPLCGVIVRYIAHCRCPAIFLAAPTDKQDATETSRRPWLFVS